MKPILLMLAAALMFAQRPAATSSPAPTFADEFEGRELDLTKWSPHSPLSDLYAAEGATVSGGQLHLAGSGGAVSTFGLFSQNRGRFEIRCKVPAGAGVRAGFHLLPVPLAPLPAIDVFELEGDGPSKITFANRWGTEQTERSYGDTFDGPDLSNGFHVIAAEWDADKIAWYVDGKERFESTEGVPRQPMFLLIEVQGGSAGTSFDIDYVRVFRGR